MLRCPGSGERSDRVHSSGAIMCPACNGAYPSSGFTVPEHQVEAERPLNDPSDIEDLIGAVARGWCSPENEHKVMDEQLAMAIADEVFPLIVKWRTRCNENSDIIHKLIGQRDNHYRLLEHAEVRLRNNKTSWKLADEIRAVLDAR